MLLEQEHIESEEAKKELLINSGYVTTSSDGSPCPTEDERCDLHDPKDGFRKKRILKRQISKETQDVGVAMRRRSSLVRKLSKHRYQPSSGEDSDEQDVAGKPFKVEVQPRHQEQKEGSQVKFECNISGETEVRYQWFKDDSTIQGQRNSSLVLDPVRLEEFGNYKCEVKYDDGDREKCVTSLPAKLDVIPSDGMELKCLTNVDPNIQEKVGNLLTKKKPGTQTWKQLAIKYAMEDHLIVSLENNQATAGREVIEFLAKSNPKLTVYEVCKDLKDKDIRRLDIIEVLSPHLSAPISGGVDSDEQDEIVQERVRGSSVPTIRFKASKGKLSGAGTPNKEDFQDPKEEDDTKIVAKPFKVVVQPRHQEQKEGSQVKFECNISGETEVRYQWFKDDSTIQGQRNSSLILDPVKVEDFGNYKCEVKYDDGDSVKCVTSLPAELDVVPCDGMELKCLRDVDLYIQEKVGNLLTKKKPGIRTWKQLAIKYAMADHHIVSLENSQERAGREVLEFLAKSNPKLTVYEVCKELKEKDIRRFDIVEILLAHLSAPISGGDMRL